MKHFVYLLCWPNGDPFYVGQGSNNRPQEHIIRSQNGSLTDTSRVIRSIMDIGGEVIIKKILESDDLSLIKETEKSTIRSLGKQFVLTNRVFLPKKPKQKAINVRWEIPETLRRKIACYQKMHGLHSVNDAAVILLEKITDKMKPLEILTVEP